MKLVVTGALGHIGSALIRGAARRFPEAEIVMIDNLSTQRFASLFDLPKQARYRFVEGDVRALDLQPILADAAAVVHLAAITDAAGSVDRAEEVEANNYLGTQAVAEACLAADRRLITLSSTSVYGTQKAVVDEDCDAEDLAPQSPYARTKLKEERLVRDMAEQRGLKAVSLRFGTIFGPSAGMRFHTAVNKFCWQACMGLPITVWRTAYDQKRPYLDLEDAVAALCLAAETPMLSDGAVYNVLTCNATVREVVETIRARRPELTVDFVDNRIMNQLSYEVACEKFRRFGFAPKGDLKRGVDATLTLLEAASSVAFLRAGDKN